MSTISTITARDIMTRQIITVADHWSIATLIDFFSQHRISGAPVRSATQELIGVVTLSDIMRLNSKPEQALQRTTLNQYYQSTLEGYTPEELGLSQGDRHNTYLVREIMTQEMISVSDDTAMTEVARTLAERNIHRVFVSDDQGVCGVISTLDILQQVAQAH